MLSRCCLRIFELAVCDRIGGHKPNKCLHRKWLLNRYIAGVVFRCTTCSPSLVSTCVIFCAIFHCENFGVR